MTIKEAIEGMVITDTIATYRVGFINSDGVDDETEFNVENTDDLEKSYQIFCEDNGLREDTVVYVERISVSEMCMMNVGHLKNVIKDLPDDMPVFVACQGYCNYNFDRKQPFDETDTFGIVHDGKLFITDDCSVDIGNGETL